MEYDPDRRRWSRRWRSFPNMIFDRCRIQKSPFNSCALSFTLSAFTVSEQTFTQQMDDTSSIIHQKRFRPHLPDTRIVTSTSDIHRMLNVHPTVYFKPINGTGGRGILRITKVPGVAGTYEIRGRNSNRSIIRPKRMPSGHLAQYLSGWGNRDRYLVQEESSWSCRMEECMITGCLYRKMDPVNGR